MLHSLWLQYTPETRDDQAAFARGLTWATEPVHRSIALLRQRDGFLPYDWIVDYGARRRDVNTAAWGYLQVMGTTRRHVATSWCDAALAGGALTSGNQAKCPLANAQ
jgi:hypothetical protein